MIPRRLFIPAEARAAAEAVLAKYLQHRRLPAYDAKDLAEKTIIAFISAKDTKSRKTRGFSPISIALAKLEVGQIHHFSGSSLQVLRQRFASARKINGNYRMEFRCRTLPSGEVQVKRLPDGAKVERDPLDNPKVREIVSIPLGKEIRSTTVTAVRGVGELGSNSKVMARKYLQDSSAQWTTRTVGESVYIKRVK